MSDARTICEALGGKWRGRSGLSYCPAHDNRRTPALSIATGSDGRLLLHCHAGCDFAAILDALRGRGLIEGRGMGAFTPDPAAAAKREAEARREAEKRSRQARAVWDEAQPIEGTAGETYLRGRGIRCPLPPSLRFHAEAWHGPTARRHPAIVAAVEGGDAFGVHRTFIKADGSGKAGLEGGDKLMLGSVAGAAVRLTDGPGPLLVGEGIESTFSAFILRGDPTARARAALSTSGMAGLRLPDLPGALVVAPDDDKAGRGAALTLADRAARDGWSVSIMAPPLGGDFNDLLRQEVTI
jgi:hypothetical protein